MSDYERKLKTSKFDNTNLKRNVGELTNDLQIKEKELLLSSNEIKNNKTTLEKKNNLINELKEE